MKTFKQKALVGVIASALLTPVILINQSPSITEEKTNGIELKGIKLSSLKNNTDQVVNVKGITLAAVEKQSQPFNNEKVFIEGSKAKRFFNRLEGQKDNSVNKDIKLSKAEKKAAKKANRLSNRLQKMAASGGSELVDVIVKYNQLPKISPNSEIKLRGGEVKDSFNKFSMRSVKIPANQLLAFAETNHIKFISYDSPVQSLSISSKQTVKRPNPNSSNYVQANLDIGVAVLDSGVDDESNINLVENVNILSGDSEDTFGHGTLLGVTQILMIMMVLHRVQKYILFKCLMKMVEGLPLMSSLVLIGYLTMQKHIKFESLIYH